MELVRQVALHDPELAQEALRGVRRYQAADRQPHPQERPPVCRIGGASLRDCGGSGPVLVLVPSLINPPTILDLDQDCSLADALAKSHRVFLLDWGTAEARQALSLDDHVEQLLVPLFNRIGPAILVGYCLGGTLALAAAARSALVRAVATLAAPYRFSLYPTESRAKLLEIWQAGKVPAYRLGLLPMEVLQTAFWQIDPGRLVAKFARFAASDANSAEARRFVVLEDWANGGEPLPLAAARQLAEQLFDGPGTLSPLPCCPMLHITAVGDRIVPASTVAPAGQHLSAKSGHVGMIVGRDAPERLHAPLQSWLEGIARGG